MPLSAGPFENTFASGATVVTPNRRLARALVARHDEAQRAAGLAVWPAAKALPWDAWLATLWQDALATDATRGHRQLIADGPSAHLWERLVAAEAGALLDAPGAAAHAAQAWSLFHAWRRPDEPFEAWAHAGIGDDAATFARWAERYRDALRRRDLFDFAQLADTLAAAASDVPALRGVRVELAGFVELSPQQRRLIDALRAAGAEVTGPAWPTGSDVARFRVECPTRADELARALAWARDRVLADPTATIGIAIEDLASCRAEVIAQAEDILCPELAAAMDGDLARPYGMSLGLPLSEIPITAMALALIALAAAPLPAGIAAALLRSPYLPGAEAKRSLRARAERTWREQGRSTIAWANAVGTLTAHDHTLAERWRRAAPLPRGAHTPAQWAAAWRAWLDALGWPGEQTLSSGEWQAREAWSRLLGEFGGWGVVAGALSREDALAALRGLAARTVFQPEGAPARIQIMGLLEASGMTFDGLWIAGLTAERWPPPPQPNPLLPLAWQRERDVPRSNAARELAYARALTDGFAGAAAEVIASHARSVDGSERAGSALVGAWPLRSLATLPSLPGRAQVLATAGAALETCDDTVAPALPSGSAVRGGARVIESQSACPFQAFALFRLRADPWPDVSEGLTPFERGTLLHAALAALWSDLGNGAALCALDDGALDARIAAAVEAARGKVSRNRWRAIPAAVAAGEARRLATTIRAWLDAVERERPPFAVRAIELRTALTLSGIALTLQIDRVDQLDGGGIAIIDYKSGRTVAPNNWFADRPSGTQIGLYALAHKLHVASQPVRAVAYAQVKAGAIAVSGLAADAVAWPALRTPAAARIPLVRWPDIEAWWAGRFAALAEDFRAGAAAVTPRDADCCRRCALQPLCRVRALEDEVRADGTERDDG